MASINTISTSHKAVSIICFFLISQYLLVNPLLGSTSKSIEEDSTDIRYIEIKNKQLHTFIKKYIKEKRDSINIFKKGYGYIKIDNINFKNKLGFIEYDNNFSLNTWANDTIVSFSISISSIALFNEEDTSNSISNDYPPYYSFIDNQIVLLYDKHFDFYMGFNKYFSKKSKQKLQELIFPFLKLSLEENFIFRGLNFETFTLSIDQRKKMTNEDILKKASFSLYIEDKVSILRNGKILQEFITNR